MILWVEYLQQFDFKIEFKSGKENFVADALSQLYSTQVNVIEEDKYLDWPLLIAHYLQHRRSNDDVPNEIQELKKRN